VSTYLRYGIIENLDTVRHIRCGTVWGVALAVTPLVWLNPPIFFALRLLANLPRDLPPTARVVDALLFALAVQVASTVHALGHIIGGKLVGSAMDELLLTATRDVTHYHGDQAAYPGAVHCGRALGGPLANLLVAGVCAAWLARLSAGTGLDLVAALVAVNRFFGIGGFLPLPSVDGIVIWREVLRPLRARRGARS
jgi:hypothetical protein